MSNNNTIAGVWVIEDYLMRFVETGLTTNGNHADTKDDDFHSKHIEASKRVQAAIDILINGLPPSREPGEGWVKASKRLPDVIDFNEIHYRLDGKKSTGVLLVGKDFGAVFEYRSPNGWQIVEDLSRVEWYDESPSITAPEKAPALREEGKRFSIEEIKMIMKSFAMECMTFNGLTNPEDTINAYIKNKNHD